MMVRKPSEDSYKKSPCGEGELAALRYASEGFQIVPCHSVEQGNCTCGKSECRKAGKHPRIRKWPTLATSEPAKIKAWWRKWPNSNVGVATGAGSKIVVFDFDGMDGEQTLKSLVDGDPSILSTRIHRTGGGGTHLFFRHPGGTVKNAVRRLSGMDIRADNGLIILPPSSHVSGRCYSVESEQPITAIPDSLRNCHKEDDDHKESKDDDEMKSMKQGGGWGLGVRKRPRKKKRSHGISAIKSDWRWKNHFQGSKGFDIRKCSTSPDVSWQ